MLTVHQERVKPPLLFGIDLAFKTGLWQEKKVNSPVPLRVSSLVSSRNKIFCGVSPCFLPHTQGQLERRQKPEQQDGPQGRSAGQRGKGPTRGTSQKRQKHLLRQTNMVHQSEENQKKEVQRPKSVRNFYVKTVLFCLGML